MSGTIIDDADAGVVYSGNWASYSGRSTAYRGTIHESNSLNDRATFSFQGVGVLVNSGQPGVGWRVRSSYAIDGGSPTVYSNDSYQSTMDAYRSPTLSNGQHTLIVINLDNRSLFLDSFLILTSDDPVPASLPSGSTSTSTGATTSTSVSSNSNIPNSGSSTTTSTSTTNSGFLAVTPPQSSTLSRSNASSTPSPSSATKPEDPGQIFLIVGPISGAIFICGLIILYLLLRRRRKKKESDSLFTPAAFNNPIRFQPATWENGQKPSAFIHNSNEPPPYIEESQLPSSSLPPNRHPAKFSAG